MEIGAVLKKMRMRAGYNQEQLAHELNMTQSTISKLERNRKVADFQTVMRWADTTCAKDIIIAFMLNTDVATVAHGLLQILGGLSLWTLYF
ncbi:helix-turn-helix domain-containing protein [Desertibacillus haloalkaliphilus]|uniref:helix-turn-helix domain-containing protein n=1 Tax=Desertibacillus haloalkaliphilus TaxID=1328930 RepID=UPI001C25F48C|nr:helix-turn-helix transcriptional regulator [Desertibacillus haloalkaliphilus]MBU8908549.1 helix-turn-helix domain-containing protein [Desertibacillus haloalkaliphilus]